MFRQGAHFKGMAVESIEGRGATRNEGPTRFNLKQRTTDGD